MKKNEVISTQKEEKGKAMLTTAGAVVTGAVAGAGVDRLFFDDGNMSTGETTEEKQHPENNAATQVQGNAGLQVANNVVGQQVSHHDTASHTAHEEVDDNMQAEGNAEATNNENVEAEAEAVAERLVGHDETPNEVNQILNENNEDAVILYTENGTEVPLVEASLPNEESTLAEMSEEEISDDLFEEDSDSLFSDGEANELADLGEGVDIDSEDDPEILGI